MSYPDFMVDQLNGAMFFNSYSDPVQWCQKQFSRVIQPLDQDFSENLLELSKRIGLCIAAILLIIPSMVISGIAQIFGLSKKSVNLSTVKPTPTPPMPTPTPTPVPTPAPTPATATATVRVAPYEGDYICVTDLMELGEESIPFNEDLLSQYLSEIPSGTKNRRFLVLSLDRGGFGDFVFGLKSLDMIRRKFPQAEVALVTDSPQRAALVNANYKHTILQPKNIKNQMPLIDIVPSIIEFRPDFLIVAPITNFNRTPLAKILETTPHLFIREYGFTERFFPMQGDEYISGAGEKFQGMMIHSDLVKWAASEDFSDPLIRLRNLQQLADFRITRALLQAEYSEESIVNFSQQYELFLGYSQRPESKREFIISIAKMAYQHAKIKKNLCFFFMGHPNENLLALLEGHSKELTELQIGRIEFSDPVQGGNKIIVLDPNKSKILRMVQAQLSSEDVIIMLKASEKETLTTGDQFWSETISANKRWIQEVLYYKSVALSSVVELAKIIPSYLKGDRAFYPLLQEAQRFVPLSQKQPLERCDAQALLLYQARTNVAIAKDWEALNRLITSEHILEKWMLGMIVKKILEHNSDSIKQVFDRVLQDKTIKASAGVDLLLQCYDAWQRENSID